MILAPRLALCLLVAGLCIVHAQGMVATRDCCESFRNTRMNLGRLWMFTGYEIQGPESGCRITALVLITIKDRKLCYPPGSRVAIEFKNALDKKNALNMKPARKQGGKIQYKKKTSS